MISSRSIRSRIATFLLRQRFARFASLPVVIQWLAAFCEHIPKINLDDPKSGVNVRDDSRRARRRAGSFKTQRGISHRGPAPRRKRSRSLFFVRSRDRTLVDVRPEVVARPGDGVAGGGG